MRIVDFTADHIEQALCIAKQNYKNERQHVPALPPIDNFPDFSGLVKNGLGVTAFDGDEMVGFLSCVGPVEHIFHSTDAVGVFSPMHGNGAIGEERANIYAKMYQAAGVKWVKAGATSHAVCLYAHDKEVQEQFFRYGFGLRCVDAIRQVEEINPIECPGYAFSELTGSERLSVYPYDVLLDGHMAASPTFILRSTQSKEEFVHDLESSSSRYFAAKKGDEIVAFMKLLEGSGETFLTDLSKTQHIHHAFCVPEHRGRGVNQSLLAHILGVLKNEGYTHLGVDFESINPAAYNFWLKHFSAFTHSVVRRIDEHVMGNM